MKRKRYTQAHTFALLNARVVRMSVLLRCGPVAGLFLVGVVAVSVLLTGCVGPFQFTGTTDSTDSTDSTGSLLTGRVIVSIGQTEQLERSSVHPDDDLLGRATRYILTFIGTGDHAGETVSLDPYTLGSSVELTEGFWELSLRAYQDAGQIAAGIVLPDGNNVIHVIAETVVSANVELRPLQTSGVTGTLDLSVTWSTAEVTLEQIEMTNRITGNELVAGEDYHWTLSDAPELLVRGDAIPSGYYELAITLALTFTPTPESSDTRRVHIFEIVGIYDNQVSSASIYLEELFVETITVTFDPNGGTPPSVESKLVVWGYPYGTLPAVEPPTGYTFNGWNTSPDGSGDPVDATVPVTIATDHSVYAQWTPEEEVLGAAWEVLGAAWEVLGAAWLPDPPLMSDNGLTPGTTP